MRSRLALVLPLSLIPLLCLAASSPPVAHKAAPLRATAFEQAVWPFFAKNCLSCHNSTTKAGSLDLASLKTPVSIVRSRETWESVQRKIQTDEMPPKGSPRPDASQRTAFLLRTQSELERSDRSAIPNPGSVTAHRLNRAEYNNTVRDLLGVNFRPADDFPQDDSGYGFDNISAVLSLSPSQMEKYVSASEKIARTAVFGYDELVPTIARHEASGRNIVVGNLIPISYDVTGLTLPNSLHTMHRFPVDGEYMFRYGMNGSRPLGSEKLPLGLWIDGTLVKAFDIDAEGSAGFAADRQDFSGKTQECRVRVTAGDHWIDATIAKLYEGLPESFGGPNPSKRHVSPPEFKPPPGLPPERLEAFRKRFEARKKEIVPTNDVRISSVEIGGPYAQSKGASDASLRRIFSCGHLHGGHNAICARKIVSDLARRAFRRPVTSQEIDRFTSLIALAQRQGDSFEEGVCLAVQGLLVSPHFLFRIERDPSTAVAESGHPITQHELASRLSYFLWSTMPDDELRGCADRQLLRKPNVLTAQVRRMLKDPRSHALAENFGGQWLQVRSLESVHPDRGRFPDFDDYLRMSMRRETEMFFDSIVHEDRSVLDFLEGKYTFLNGRLAKFYGIAGVDGPEFRKVDLTGTVRGGILTQASVLTVTSYANRTSPVLRGKWVLDNILNAPPPAPPPGVPNLDVSSVGTGASLRQQLEEHRKNPTCAACHARMDPLGFALENFNAVGAWRQRDGKIPIDASGSLPDGRSFKGSDGLKTILKADRAAFAQCLTAKLLTYSLGRGLERYDRPTLNQIRGRLAAQNYRFSGLVLEIVNSRPFQMRRGDSLK